VTDSPTYRNLAVPDGIRVILQRSTERAIRLMAAEGMVVHQDAKARQLDALEMILAEWSSYTEERWRYWWNRATPEQRAKFEAKERDGFQCLRCGKTRLNQGSLESHHIISKGMRGDPLYAAIVRKYGSIHCIQNLATLCTECHHRWGHAGTRKAALWLLEKIGTIL
jgi:hypothetical protein